MITASRRQLLAGTGLAALGSAAPALAWADSPQAGKPDLPGLYISRRCTYAWETLPALPRDPRDIEDVDSSAPDHAADALRYGTTWTEPPSARSSTHSVLSSGGAGCRTRQPSRAASQPTSSTAGRRLEPAP